jgi:hypothetical protein
MQMVRWPVGGSGSGSWITKPGFGGVIEPESAA